MTTLQAFAPPPGTVDFTGGVALFANDFRSSVAGTITGVWYYHSNSNEGANVGVSVHRVSDEFELATKSVGTGSMTDNAFNLITLDSPVVYATPNQLVCLSVFYPTGMGFAFTGGLSDLTVGDLTVIRSTARFKNAGPPVLGDFPNQNTSNAGFAVGIEFVAGAGHAKGAEFLPFF
jgi:hypothetical protein